MLSLFIIGLLLLVGLFALKLAEMRAGKRVILSRLRFRSNRWLRWQLDKSFRVVNRTVGRISTHIRQNNHHLRDTLSEWLSWLAHKLRP